MRTTRSAGHNPVILSYLASDAERDVCVAVLCNVRTPLDARIAVVESDDIEAGEHDGQLWVHAPGERPVG